MSHAPESDRPLTGRLLAAGCGLLVGSVLVAGPGSPPPVSPSPADPAEALSFLPPRGRGLRMRRLIAIRDALRRGETTYQFTVGEPLPPLAGAGK